MRNISVTIWVMVVVLWLGLQNASATTLGTMHCTVSGGTSEILTAMSLELTYDYTLFPNPYKYTYLFEDILVTPSDVGATFVASATTDPHFDLFVSVLTNGVDDMLRYWMMGPSGGSGAGKWESVLFSDSICGGVDLFGCVVEEVTLTINSLTLDSPGTNPNGDGIWTDFSGDYTFSFNGIPEPAEVIDVAVDIKPGSCPNPVNVKSQGVVPVAILGTETFDVDDIDIASIRLEGVAPIRSNYEDVATVVVDGEECECTTEGADGYRDLTLKFDTQSIVAAIREVNHGDELRLALRGVLLEEFGGTPIEGVDCIVIRGRHKPFNEADINKDGVVNMTDFTLMTENWLQSSIVDE